MESKHILYSELREKAFNLRSENKLPKSLVFNTGSAYSYGVEDGIFNNIIPTIDNLLLKEQKTDYDKSLMRIYKDRLHQMLNAMEHEELCDVPLSEWREDKLKFTQIKV